MVAARQDVQAYQATQHSLREFYDPRLLAAIGTGKRLRAIPGASLGYGLDDDAATVEAGVEQAIAPGLYASLGVAHRYRWDALGSDDVIQDLVGAQIRIPLLNDRGFRQYDLQQQRALAEYLAAHSRLLATGQTLRRDVILAYITTLETHAQWQATTAAAQRVSDLRGEAEQLARLKVIPEYQLLQATLEVNLRLEEAVSARLAFDQAQLQLTRLTHVPPTDQPMIPNADLVSWAAGTTLDVDAAPVDAYPRRGSWLERENLRRRGEADVALARDDLSGSLDLTAGVTWQGETTSGHYGDSALLSRDQSGGAIALVYSRPLSYTGPRQRHRAAVANLEAATARRVDEELSIQNAITQAQLAYTAALERLRTSTAAVDLARQTLTAEAERFRLGEGLSRNVLDAQKDLTSTIQLQTRTAAQLLRAKAEHHFGIGHLPAPLWQALSAEGTPP